MSVAVKICGITSVEDGVAAVASGCDAIGLNFYPSSVRYVDIAVAGEVAARVSGSVAVVAVFVDPPPSAVEEVLRRCKIDMLQFHGDEEAGFCEQFGEPYIKACRVTPGFEFGSFADVYDSACALMLDAGAGNQFGGSGHTFDWSLWPRSERRLVLAGGLNPENVGDAVRATRPWAVDAASGVEGNVKGRKDAARMGAFVKEVHSASGKS